jgi:NAD(P)-dependent dehydrogenase (short-subunit alcohol dehydrogenase family)
MEREKAVVRPFTFDLRGRTALITGASSGIGRRAASVLAASGARVVIAARRPDLLESLKAEIVEAGGQALAIALDVADEAATIAAYDSAERTFGPIDTVVANAGVNGAGSALGLSMDVFDQLSAINFRGAFLTVREGARRMIAAGSPQSGRGRIVVVSSITAQHVTPHAAAYSGTKAAVLQMARALARDWSMRGINVNVICPGYIQTDLTEGLWDTHWGKKMLEDFSRKRLVPMEALDPILLYLCSDSSAAVTGSSFTIDDGQTL